MGQRMAGAARSVWPIRRLYYSSGKMSNPELTAADSIGEKGWFLPDMPGSVRLKEGYRRGKCHND